MRFYLLVQLGLKAKNIKITYDSIKNANAGLSSAVLESNGYRVNIPSSLLYRFVVIPLNECVLEGDF